MNDSAGLRSGPCSNFEPSATTTLREARLREVKCEAIARLDLSERSWLVISMTPHSPGQAEINAVTFQEFQQEVLTGVALIVGGAPDFHRASVGRRQLLADDSYDTTNTLAQYISANLHVDGSGSFCLAMAHLNRQSILGADSSDDVTVVDDEWTVIGLLSGLHFLGNHAKNRAFANGHCSIHAQIVAATTTTSLQIGHTRGHGFAQSRGRAIPITSVGTWLAESAVDLSDIVAYSPTLVSVAANLAIELGQAFGVVELGQLDPQGAVRRQYWGRQHAGQMLAWAQENDIPVNNNTIASNRS